MHYRRNVVAIADSLSTQMEHLSANGGGLITMLRGYDRAGIKPPRHLEIEALEWLELSQRARTQAESVRRSFEHISG